MTGDNDTPSAEIADEIGAIIEDPSTEAFTFAAIDEEGFVSGYGESSGKEEQYRSICAAVLVQFTSASDDDEEQFIKEVVREYNKRKKVSQADHWGLDNGK